MTEKKRSPAGMCLDSMPLAWASAMAASHRTSRGSMRSLSTYKSLTNALQAAKSGVETLEQV